MINPAHLASRPLAELQTAIAHPDPDLWSQLTAQDLQDLRRRCHMHWTARYLRLHPLQVFAMVLVPVSLLYVWQWGLHNPGTPAGWLGFLGPLFAFAAVTTALGSLAMAVIFSVCKLDTISTLSDRLKAVPQAEHYAKFPLNTLAPSENAQAYYDQIKALGRDLCVVDFDVMLKLAAADRLNSQA